MPKTVLVSLIRTPRLISIPTVYKNKYPAFTRILPYFFLSLYGAVLALVIILLFLSSSRGDDHQRI